MTALELLDAVRRLPDGAALTLSKAELVAALSAAVVDAVPAAAPAPDAQPESWRTRLWVVPPDTRLGVREAAEALGRSRSWIHHRTGRKSAERIPHRRLGGALVFLAGELRDYLERTEDVVAAAPAPLPRLRLRGTR